MFEEITTFFENLFGIEHVYNPENMDYSGGREAEIDRETWDAYETYGVDTSVERTHYYELDNFEPENCESMENVYGYPDKAVELWEEQEGNRCALYSQKFIIEEITGAEIDIEAMADIAEAYGWFTEESGTPKDYMDEMLNYCGIPNESLYCSGYDEFRSYIQNGDRIIVAIDANEYWCGEYDNLYEGEAPNHAVEVIGIDESDPEHPMVVLNDSGIPNGQGVRVPADTFMEAWEDSGYYMVRVPVYGDMPGADDVINTEVADESDMDNAASRFMSIFHKTRMENAYNSGDIITYRMAKEQWEEAVARERAINFNTISK